MKISDASGQPVSGLGPLPRPAGNGRNSNPGANAVAGDQIQLSNLLARLLDGGASEHLTKLARLASAVGTGQYHVDANVVSAGIIEHSLALGSAG